MKLSQSSAALGVLATGERSHCACKGPIYALPPLCDQTGKVVYEAMLVDAEFPGAIAYEPIDAEVSDEMSDPSHMYHANQFLQSLASRLEELAALLEQGSVKNAVD